MIGTSGNIRTAVRNLRRNKTRSLLTMLGVIIGVTSVVLTVAVGEGIKREIGAQASRLGMDLITVRPGQALLQHGSILSGLLVRTDGVLTGADVAVVKKSAGVTSGVPLSVVHSSVSSSERNRPLSMLVIGTEPDFPVVTRQTLDFGAFFGDGSSTADKVVLGAHAASQLFDEQVPLGQTLSVLGHQFIVVGILSDSQIAPLSTDADFNDAVFMSYATAQAITNNNSPIYEILARPADQKETDTVIARVRNDLLAAHGGQKDFSVFNQSDAIQATSQILNLMTVLISGVAAISLVVGGVGIMNVMLVSVTERMHEIGIRKALGATNRQIMVQFITEAAVLSLIGGFVGLLIAFIVSGAIALATSISPAVMWQSVVIATGASVSVGILFGSVPALKAASKDPIAALRNE